MQPMEVLLSAKLVRRTERADGSTRQLEHRSVSERLAGRSLRQSGSGSMTGRRSRHRRSAASAVSRRRRGQGVGAISCSEPDRSLLVLPGRCPPWRAKRRMLADVFHWRQIRSAARRDIKCRQANNASAPLSGKEGDDSVSLARSGERSEKALPKALCTREVSDNSDSR